LKVSTVTTGGFTGLTTLGLGSLPTGVSASFSAPALGPNASALLTLTTSAETPSPSTIEVRGTATIEGSALTRTATATVAIQAPGQTSLAGQVRDEDDKPLAGVSIILVGTPSQTLGTTDAGGNFLVPVPLAGSQVFLVDGSTANSGSITYHTVPITAVLTPGIVNPLGFLVYLHVRPVTQPLPVAPSVATPLTVATAPDLVLTLPAGVRIIGWDGQPNTQIGVRAVPLDRLPLPPLPGGFETNTVYMFTFGKVGGGTPKDAGWSVLPIPVTVPNTVGAYPGQQVELWYYNEAPDGSAPNQWAMFGFGTVSNNGKLIVSNPGVGIPRFCCGAITWRKPPPPQGTPPDEGAPDPCPDCTEPPSGSCPNDCEGSSPEGDPVEPASGIFLHRRTDVSLPGRVPIVLTRIYRTNDPTLGPFGIGTSSSYDAYLRQKTTELVMLFLPGNNKSRWTRQADGSYAVGDKGPFRGAKLTKHAEGTWTLRYKNGRQWQFNAAGWLIAQQDRNGNQLIMARDGQNRTTALREPSGRELTFSYSGSDLKVTQVTDPLGRTVQYQYDGSNRLTQVTDPANGTWQYTYDSGHRMLTVINPRGILQTQNTYDAQGRVATQTLADTGLTRFTYTVVAGTVTATTVTEPLGNSRTLRFSQGYAAVRIDALGQVGTAKRAPGSHLLQSTTDRLGNTTQFQYDAAGNLTQRTNALTQSWSYTYDPVFNHVTSITDPLENRTTFAYDAKGNLIAITDPEQNRRPAAERLKTTFTYTEFGEPLTVTNPLGQTTAFEYDATGNLTATIDPLGHRTERTYDAVSRLLTVKDPNGAVTQFSYDVLDRLVSITDPLNGTTRFTYDENGNLLTVTDAKNQTTIHTYDSMDRLDARTDALTRTESFTYDLNGNLKTVTDRKGQTTTHIYDGTNRRTRTDYADGSSVSYQYDPAGNLLSVSSFQTGTITRSYDVLHRLASEVTTQGAVGYGYDAVGRRQTMQASGLPPVTYSYDTNSRLTGVAQAPQAAGLTYDAANRRTALALPNGIVITYSYDDASRLIGQVYTGPGGLLGDLTYTYDAAGNRIATGGSWARSLLPASVLSSNYDQANEQLQFGNVTQTFDANGNLLTQTGASGTTTYTWDAKNRLTAIGGPVVNASFAYDAFGRRNSKMINGVATTFQYDGLDIVRDSGADGEAAYLRTLALDGALARTDASSTLVYLLDILGSTLALADSGGAVVTEYTYAPFGQTSVSGLPSPNPFQFTGRENDGSGLYHYRARYYDPIRNRFISEDPIGLAGGINLRAYLGNNPLRRVDPLGLYGRDVHYDLTYKLALEAGIDPRIAQRIAEANQSVDEAFFQRPDNPVAYPLGSLDLHFPRRADTEQELMRCVTLRMAEEFGRQLHRLQDTFSHQGVDPVTHLFTGGTPDVYSPESPRDQAMEQATKMWLGEFKRALDNARPLRRW
jgi:RHS repeat-associated protein